MTLRLLRIPRQSLFSSPEGKQFPDRITILADIRRCQADIDVIIGAHEQAEAVNLTVDNFLALEKKTRLHILVIESSRRLSTFWRIRSRPRVSKILILSDPPCTSRKYGGAFWASNGVALAAQLGSYLGSARYAFFSHTDMMGYKENFLSFLLSKLSENIPSASFTQRHVLPFSGCMLFDKNYFRSVNSDWLPKSHNPCCIPALDQLRSRIDHLNWLDAGEEPILSALEHGRQAYVCASRGAARDYYDYYGHPLVNYGLSNEEVNQLGVPIRYASLPLSREAFDVKYPEFASNDRVWRKCFDDQGDVVFIHRGRGASKEREYDGRGDFVSFVREFNRSVNRPAS